MEYTSPLSYNFKLDESLASQDDSKSESERRSHANSCSDLDISFNQSYFSRDQKRIKKDSYFQRVDIGSNQKNKWDSTCQKHWKGNKNSSTASDYYHPSMIEDPWKELEEKAASK